MKIKFKIHLGPILAGARGKCFSCRHIGKRKHYLMANKQPPRCDLDLLAYIPFRTCSCWKDATIKKQL